ncbi:hypothetical protein BGZ60DRAFT_396834 [Tricladium varicosporioides]|nr:hypothetical protein BGZ60DRAFT_396834 [Hymenoscyphus varicosporioides]
MGFWNEKHPEAITSSTVSQEPLRGSRSRNSQYTLPDYEKKDITYKKRIRIFRLITRILSLITNAIVVGTLSFTLAKYYLTKNKVIEGNVHPWITPTILWPSLMLLGMAAATFLLNAITLCCYCRGVNSANKAATVTTVASFIFLAIHVTAWIVVAGLYRWGRTGNDLWGYSCSDKADAIQEQVKDFIDFGKLCTMQEGTWFVSIIEAIVYLLTFIITVWMVRRASTKRKIGKIRESMSMETGYAQNLEMGTMHSQKHGKKYMPLSG